jgi:hypothetical protein
MGKIGEAMLCGFKPCGKGFICKEVRQQYCKRPKCARERKQAANRKSKAVQDLHFGGRMKSTLRRKCKYCIRKTANYFGICDDCRNSILRGIDANMGIYE